MKEGMNFETREVGQPHKRGPVVDQDISNIGPAWVSTRHRKFLDPRRREDWRIFLIEKFAPDAVREPL